MQSTDPALTGCFRPGAAIYDESTTPPKRGLYGLALVCAAPSNVLLRPLLFILVEPEFHNTPCEVHHSAPKKQAKNYKQELHAADISSPTLARASKLRL